MHRAMSGSGRRLVGVAAAALALCAKLPGADSPTGGEPGVRAYVLTNIYFGSPGEAGACKTLSDAGLETYFKMLPPEEQAKYATPDKRQALEKVMNDHFGFRRLMLWPGDFGGKGAVAKLPPDVQPHQTPTPEQVRAIAQLNGFPKGRGRLAYQNQTIAYSACTDPGDFPMLAKGFQPYDGKEALGMNLDGKVGRGDYVSPSGEAGVDNQLWHAIGCSKIFGEQGDAKIAKNTFISARAPTIIELRGLDSLENDPDVIVNIYAGADPVTRNGRRDALAWASFRVDPDKSLRASTHGRVVNSVLTTDPVDLKLNYKEQIIDAPRVIRSARIRISLRQDGSVEGQFAGYYTLDSFYSSIEQMTQNGANLTGVSCPGVRQAIDKFADGYRDAKTGHFTAISSEMSFFGVPAFIVGDAVAADGNAPYNAGTAQ